MTFRHTLLFGAFGAGILVFNPPAEGTRKDHRPRSATVLYHLKSDATPEEIAALREVAIKYGFRLDKNILRGKLKRAKGYRWTEGYEEELAEEIRATNAVEYAEVDALIQTKKKPKAHPRTSQENQTRQKTIVPSKTPNDPSFGSQWHLTMIGAPLAWDHTTGRKEVKVVHCDTGVDINHPDLKPNLVLPGYNTVDDTTDILDQVGHGTNTAGVLGAVGGNALGVSGVAWNISILPIKISNLPDGAAYYSDMAECVQRGADQGAKVANLSYDGGSSSAVESAGAYIRAKGGLLIAAAGNYSANLTNTNPDSPTYLIIGSTSSSDTLSGFSNFGAPIDLVAPGEDIETTTLGGNYGAVTGTSFSAPVVTGTAALIYSLNPGFTPSQVENFLLSTAVDLGAPGEDMYHGRGRLNAGAAAQKAWQSLATPTPATPTPKPATPAPSPTPSISVPTVPVTIEAESMETKTAGGGYSGVWNIWSNGYIENRVNFPVSGAFDIKVIAFGTKLGGVSPNMEIRLNSSKVASASVPATVATTYTFRVNAPAGTQKLAIAFTNDASGNGEDRNLIIDRVSITAASALASTPMPTPTPKALSTPTPKSSPTAPPNLVTITLDNAPAGIQDSAGGRTFIGRWCKDSRPDYFGIDSLYSCGTGTDSYRFTPNLKSATYDVFMRWSADKSRSTTVPIAIRHRNGTAAVQMNQQWNGGTWILLGRYNFAVGTSGYVEINDSKGNASADAVKFVPAP